jgi:hypothetical protein
MDPSWRREDFHSHRRDFLKHFVSRYFLQQNEAIASGSITGVPINLQVLGVGDGLTVCCLGLSDSACVSFAY